MTQMIAALLPLALAVIGIALVGVGVAEPDRGDLAVAGAILLGSVLISVSLAPRRGSSK